MPMVYKYPDFDYFILFCKKFRFPILKRKTVLSSHKADTLEDTGHTNCRPLPTFHHETACRGDEQLPVHSSAGEPSGETHGNCVRESQPSAAAFQMDQTTSQPPGDQSHEPRNEQSTQRHQSLPEPSPAE